MRTSHPLPVVLALTALLDGLFEAVGARFPKYPIQGPLFLHIWRRFEVIKTRFARLAKRVAAGNVLAPRKPRQAPLGARPRKPVDPTAFRIRRWVNPNFGWLVRVVPGTADALGVADYARQLETLLTTDAEMRALLAATPATSRLLRPLCRMLGVSLPRPESVGTAASCAEAPPEPRAATPTTVAPTTAPAVTHGAGRGPVILSICDQWMAGQTI